MSRVMLGMALAMGLATLPATAAQPPGGQPPGQARKYRATTAIVIDKQTGQRRLPTEQEVAALVTTLATFTTRSENLPQASTASGAVGIELGEGYGGVVLGRANEDGTIETRCVFTFEEGAGFLGLVADVQ
jgi:hypothetical protein